MWAGWQQHLGAGIILLGRGDAKSPRMQQAHFAPTATRNELCDACIGRKGNNWYSLVGRFAESEQLNVTVKRYSTEQYFCREKVPISNEWRNDLNSVIESTPS